MTRHWLKIGLLVFAGFYLLSQPEGAAGLVESAIGAVVGAGDSLARFVNALPV